MKLWMFSLLAVFGGGCTAYNDVSLVIVDTEAVTPMSNCVVPAMATVAQSQGILDVGVLQLGIGTGYVIAPIVLNNLLERANATTPERDGITVIGYDVVLKAQNVTGLGNTSFTTLISGPFLLPQTTAGTSFTAIDANTAKSLGLAAGASTDVIVQFRAKGRRADGEIDSGWSNFPVHVCNGCLTGPVSNPCPALQASQVSLGGCNLAQDLPVTCCFPAGSTAPACGSAVPTVMGM
jgi:hypothetical protein